MNRVRHALLCALYGGEDALVRAEQRQGRFKPDAWGEVVDIEVYVRWLLSEASWCEANRAAVLADPVLRMRALHVAASLERLARWLGLQGAD